MSWFIGYTGKNNPLLGEYISSLNLEKTDEVISGSFHLFYSRGKGNLIFNLESDTSGWIVTGIPVSVNADKFLKKADWKVIFSKKDFNLKNINGHFSGIRWNNEVIIFFNDRLGLRDIYFLKVNSNYLFSTRMDWIARFNKENKINFNEFSTNWLLPHQISWSAVLNNVVMLNPGGIIKITSGIIEKINTPWMPDFNSKTSPEDFVDILNKFIKLPSQENERINLGLSGGIDSRVLLQTLINNDITAFGIHTFGSHLTADGKIAKRIADDYKLEHHFFPFTIPAEDQLLTYLYDSISQLGLSSSIFETLNYPFYEMLSKQNYIIIDGAYGEIFRRAYLNRFLMLGKNALLNQDAESIFKLLRGSKSDIFNDEFNKLLENSAINQVSKLLEILPKPGSTGLENWLDTFFIKTKVANISGPSQTLLDNISRAYMPFIQPLVLDKGFSIDFSNKKNGRLFLQLINKGKKFNVYPLVKDQVIYPFSSNLLFTRFYQKLKRKIGFVYKDNNRKELLLKLKEFVLDRINSQEVKYFDLYDYKKVSNLASDFYNGDDSMANALTWLITFDIWRECFKIK